MPGAVALTSRSSGTIADIKHQEEVDKVSNAISNSNLNPNAKEFICNPNTKPLCDQSLITTQLPLLNTPQTSQIPTNQPPQCQNKSLSLYECLPTEILEKIFLDVPVIDIPFRKPWVCKIWSNIVQAPDYWKIRAKSLNLKISPDEWTVLDNHYDKRATEKCFWQVCMLYYKEKFTKDDLPDCQLRVTESNKPYGCPFCGRTFGHTCDHAEHLASQLCIPRTECDMRRVGDGWMCSLCDTYIYTKPHMARHIRDHHTHHYCPVCDEEFSSYSWEESRIRHVTMDHPQWLNKCDEDFRRKSEEIYKARLESMMNTALATILLRWIMDLEIGTRISLLNIESFPLLLKIVANTDHIHQYVAKHRPENSKLMWVLDDDFSWWNFRPTFAKLIDSNEVFLRPLEITRFRGCLYSFDYLSHSVSVLSLAIAVDENNVTIDPGIAKISQCFPSLEGLYLHIKTGTEVSSFDNLPNDLQELSLQFSSVGPSHIEWVIHATKILQPKKKPRTHDRFQPAYNFLVFVDCLLSNEQMDELLKGLAKAGIRVQQQIIASGTKLDDCAIKRKGTGAMFDSDDEDYDYYATHYSLSDLASELWKSCNGNGYKCTYQWFNRRSVLMDHLMEQYWFTWGKL